MTDQLSRPIRRARRFCAICSVALAAACQAPAPAGPAGSWSALPAADARLALNLRDLPVPPLHARFQSADGRYAEETAQWGGEDLDRPSAGLRLSEASPGPPMTDPAAPSDIVDSWTLIRDRTPAFSEPGTATNAYGPVSWWRAQLGTSVCVVFVQRLAAPAPVAATLSGFYCNPQGLPLSSPAAVAVVESVSLRQPRQPQ